MLCLIRRGELRAAKIGGRGTYRIGRDDLEAYIKRTYAETERWIDEHPFSEDDPEYEPLSGCLDCRKVPVSGRTSSTTAA